MLYKGPRRLLNSVFVQQLQASVKKSKNKIQDQPTIIPSFESRKDVSTRTPFLCLDGRGYCPTSRHTEGGKPSTFDLAGMHLFWLYKQEWRGRCGCQLALGSLG